MGKVVIKNSGESMEAASEVKAVIKGFRDTLQDISTSWKYDLLLTDSAIDGMQAMVKQLDEVAPKIDQGVKNAANEIGNRVNKALDEFEPPASKGVVGKPKKIVANELEAPKGNDLKGAATQLQNNRTRLPRKNGNWINGEPGNGYWSSDIKDVNIITGGKPIKFSNGRSDFSPWSKGSINFKPNQLDGTSADFDAVYEYIAKQKGLKSKNAAKNLLKELGLTPHHSSGTVIQLVSTKLHGNYHILDLLLI